MITLRSNIRPKSTHDTDTSSLEIRQIEATAGSYAEARAQLDELLPEGWQLLGITTWPPRRDQHRARAHRVVVARPAVGQTRSTGPASVVHTARPA